MQRVHFIAIGGASMHGLAIAVSRKTNFEVTGSDEFIPEPFYSKLKENGILPKAPGWFPEKIHKGLSAVVLSVRAQPDNPELIRAKELGLKIYSFPEYLFLQTRSKTRIVVSGSHGKTTTTAIIIHVLKKMRMDCDYMIGESGDSFENTVQLSYESRIAVFEGDEYLTSPVNMKSTFHVYKPHIAIITGIAWDHSNVFQNFDQYIGQFKKFIDLMEFQGRLIYFDGDDTLNDICNNIRRDLVTFGYNTPDYEIHNGNWCLMTKYGCFPVKLYGDHNLQNIEAARLACRQIGVTDEQFYHAITDFETVEKRLQIIAQTNTLTLISDFAHSPSKVMASVKAVRKQFNPAKLIACLELFTISSLDQAYLPQYQNSLCDANEKIVYIDADNVKEKNTIAPDDEFIKQCFGCENLIIVHDRTVLEAELKRLATNGSTILMMSPGTFSGIDMNHLAQNLAQQE